MNIRELAQRAGVTPRQVRYLIAEGFVPPPQGGRATATYGEAHEVALRRYMALKGTGLSPGAIRILLEGSMAAVFQVIPGVSLHVDPHLLGGGIDQDLVVRRIKSVLESLEKEPADAERRRRSSQRSPKSRP